MPRHGGDVSMGERWPGRSPSWINGRRAAAGCVWSAHEVWSYPAARFCPAPWTTPPYLLFCSTAMGGSDVGPPSRRWDRAHGPLPDCTRARHATVRVRGGASVAGHMMIVVDDIHAVMPSRAGTRGARKPNVQMLAAGERHRRAGYGGDRASSADRRAFNLGGTNPAVPLHRMRSCSARSQIVHGDGPGMRGLVVACPSMREACSV